MTIFELFRDMISRNIQGPENRELSSLTARRVRIVAHVRDGF
jgi:hypothetical protein